MIRINKDFEESFQRLRESHFEQCMLMSEYVYTYKEMHDLMAEYIEQMNLASSFFQLSFRAIRTSTILWIAKAFDKRESSSLYAFLGFIRQNIRYLSIEQKMQRTNSPATAPWIRNSTIIDESTIDKQLELLDTVLPVVQRIITLRDKYHAHLDRSVINNRSAFAKDNQFTWEELDVFPSRYFEIINCYSIAFDGQSRVGVPLNWNDLENLLRPLHGKGLGKQVE